MTPIFFESWKEMGEVWEEGFDAPTSNRLYVTTDHIADFFRAYPNYSGTVISGASDYSLCYQEDYPPELHFSRWIPMTNMAGIGYHDLIIPARMEKTKCLSSDRDWETERIIACPTNYRS